MRISTNGKMLLERMKNGRQVFIFKGRKGEHTYNRDPTAHCGELYLTLTVRSLLAKGLVVEELGEPENVWDDYIGKLKIAE